MQAEHAQPDHRGRALLERPRDRGTVDWGDGTPVQTVTGPNDPPLTHTFRRAGRVTAVFTATDQDGDTGGPTEVIVTVGPSSAPAPAPPDHGALAPTGSPAGAGTTGLGLLLVAIGGAIVGARRRRIAAHG